MMFGPSRRTLTARVRELEAQNADLDAENAALARECEALHVRYEAACRALKTLMVRHGCQLVRVTPPRREGV